MPCQADVHARNASGVDGPRFHREVLGGLGEFGDTAHLVEFDAERVGDQPDRLAEDRCPFLRHLGQVGVVDRLTEPDRLLGVRRVVEGGVGGLVDGDLVDPVTHHRRHDGQQLGEARTHAGPEHRRTALLAGLEDAVAAGAQVVPGDERRRRHHIHACGKDPDQLVDVDPHRVVDHAVGFEGQQFLDVVGGGHPEWLDADQFAGIATGLLRGPGVASHQFELGVGGERL